MTRNAKPVFPTATDDPVDVPRPSFSQRADALVEYLLGVIVAASDRLRVFRRIRLAEDRLEVLMRGLEFCAGCGVVMLGKHPAMHRGTSPDGTVMSYCQWCYKLQRERGLAERRKPAATGGPQRRAH